VAPAAPLFLPVAFTGRYPKNDTTLMLMRLVEDMRANEAWAALGYDDPAGRHPKDDVRRTVMRLAVLGQLAMRGSRYTLPTAEAEQG
jgi:hypothetical protein